MKILEDDGYFCVDTLPLSLLPTLIQLTEDSSEEIERVALGIDIRGGYRSLKEAAHVLDDLKSRGYDAGNFIFGSVNVSSCKAL